MDMPNRDSLCLWFELQSEINLLQHIKMCQQYILSVQSDIDMTLAIFMPVVWSYNQRFEPRHEISNIVVCATSKASDQPAHTRSLIRAFASRLHIL